MTESGHTSELTKKEQLLFGDRYSSVSRVGEGGMGVVYKAYDKILLRWVAFKVLFVMSDEQTIRFNQEARAASRMKHQNLIEVMDFGFSQAGQPYLIMELIDGESLSARLHRVGRLSAAATISACIDICDAMEHAHNQGIVHRDLKPSNIMFTSNETLKILDFGIAKVENQLLTAQGMAMGTPDYMSPEQARGGADVDLRTDIYAVGCIMYRMLSGRLPFSGETAFDTMSQHQTEPVPELRFDGDPDIVRTFNEIIQRSLAKDKNERYASMSALKADLAAIDLREEAPSPVTVSQPALPTETKFPRWILPTVILLFIVLTAAVMSHKPEKTDAGPKGFLKAEYQPRDSGYFPFHVITRYGSSWWEPVYQFGVTDEDLKKLSDRTRHSIYFSYCPKVTGAGLRYLSHWTDLRGIDMTDCPVTDKNLELLANFKDLTMLDLNSCRFITGKSLPHLPKLERANFNSCKGLTDAGVKNISRSKNLLSLRLSFSGVSHKCLDDVTQLVRLTDLELSGLGITDSDLPKLLKLRELKSLALSENPISDNGLKVLAELPSLKTLTLDSCKNITQSGIDKLTKSRLAKSASFTVSHDKDLKHEKFDQVNDAEILLGDPVVDKL